MLYDTHAHIDYLDFENDFDGMLERAALAGVTKIISIGTNLDSSKRAIELAERHDNIFAVVGWHPCEAMDAPEDIRSELTDLAAHPRVVALGETGLDYYRMPSGQSCRSEDDTAYIARQRALFQQHLDVAANTGLNVVIHQRASFDDTLEQLTPYADRVRGVFHCFAEPIKSLERILELNSIVSYTGILTFKTDRTSVIPCLQPRWTNSCWKRTVRIWHPFRFAERNVNRPMSETPPRWPPKSKDVHWTNSAPPRVPSQTGFFQRCVTEPHLGRNVLRFDNRAGTV